MIINDVRVYLIFSFCLNCHKRMIVNCICHFKYIYLFVKLLEAVQSKYMGLNGKKINILILILISRASVNLR